MKKMAIAGAALALLAGSAYAEMKMSMWGMGGMNMWKHTTEEGELDTVEMSPGFAPLCRVGVDVHGVDPDELIGFDLGVYYNGINSLNFGTDAINGTGANGYPYGSTTVNNKYTSGGWDAYGINVGDNARVWAKLGNSGLRVKFGKTDENYIRSTNMWESWDNMGAIRMIDDLFTKRSVLAGVSLDYTKQELFADDELYLLADVDTWDKSYDTTVQYFGFATATAYKVYSGSHVAGGYTLKGLGAIKGQYYWALNESDGNSGDHYNIDVRIDAIPRTTVEAATTIYPDWFWHNGGTQVGLGINYKHPGANPYKELFNVRFGMKYYNGQQHQRVANTWQNMEFGLDGMYNVTNKIGLGLATDMVLGQDSEDAKSTDVTVTPVIRYNLARYFGYIQAGVQYEYYDSGVKGADSISRISLPIGFQFAM